MSDIRYGVVGCVGIGGSHAAAVEAADGADLVACADVVEEHAREFAADHDVAPYTDHVEMIGDADLDAISVCTPSGTHADITAAAAEAGAHVLCEKPLDVYIDRVDRMIEVCEREGVTLAGVFQRRTAPAAQRAKQAVDDGELGEPVLGNVEVKWWRDQDYYDSADWRGTREMDGGVLMNQAIHGIDLLQWLAGGVESVDASLRTLAFDIEVEDTAVVDLEFENGARGAIETTTATYPNNPVRVEINGREGSLVLENEELVTFETPAGSVEFDEEGRGSHEAVVQDFVDALREGREPMVPAREARAAVEVNLAAYASDVLDRRVRLDELRDVEVEY